MKYTLYIPIKIESVSNLREHWSKKHRRDKGQKVAIRAVWNTTVHTNINLPVTITLTRIAPRPFDPDNLASSLKASTDCVADLILPGLASGRADGHPSLHFEYRQKKGDPKEYALQIEIKEESNLGQERTSTLSPH